VFLSILFSTLPGKIRDAFQSASLTADFKAAAFTHRDQLQALTAAQGGNTSLSDTSFISRLDPVLAHPFKVGFSDAMSLVFLITAGIMVISLLVILMLPELPLRQHSAATARAYDESAAEETAAEDTPAEAAPVTSAEANGAKASPNGVTPNGAQANGATKTGAPEADPVGR
jgi:hypothetical protein